MRFKKLCGVKIIVYIKLHECFYLYFTETNSESMINIIAHKFNEIPFKLKSFLHTVSFSVKLNATDLSHRSPSSFGNPRTVPKGRGKVDTI